MRRGKRTAGAGRETFDLQKMESGVRRFLEGLGRAASPADLRETPRLVARAFAEELLSGYKARNGRLLKPLSGDAPDAMVVVQGIRFVSICRHHLLPFQGMASVAYLPRQLLAGFSSVARLVDLLARRLQLQESLTEQILDEVEASLAPRGSACLLEATHQCMTCRGARQPDSRVMTIATRGVFRSDARQRKEVVALLQAGAKGRGR